MEKALRLIDEAAGKGANIVALQELFNTPYFPNRPRDSQKYFAMAETIPGPTIDRVADKAREHNMVIMAPIYEREMAGVYYNSAAVIGPDGELIGVYRKMHIPHSDDYIEKYYFKPGNLGFPVFDTPFGKIGVLICYDRHFPEGARALGLAGAEILLIPVASPRPTASEVFVKELMGMAIANQYFVAAVNRVGVELKEEFYGDEPGVRPQGKYHRPGRQSGRRSARYRDRPCPGGDDPEQLVVLSGSQAGRLRCLDVLMDVCRSFDLRPELSVSVYRPFLFLHPLSSVGRAPRPPRRRMSGRMPDLPLDSD